MDEALGRSIGSEGEAPVPSRSRAAPWPAVCGSGARKVGVDTERWTDRLPGEVVIAYGLMGLARISTREEKDRESFRKTGGGTAPQRAEFRDIPSSEICPHLFIIGFSLARGSAP